MIALLAATRSAPLHGLALFAGAAWCLVNLLLIEKLVVAVTSAERNSSSALLRAGLSIGGMLALFPAGALLLTRFSPIWLTAGFSLPFLVIVLKAAALLILPTRLWQSLTRSPWRAAALVALL
ncbi:MAG: hypothetical protein ACRENS_12305, partial [Candidatus Eiseniibacteriota bacterium]